MDEAEETIWKMKEDGVIIRSQECLVQPSHVHKEEEWRCEGGS